jgi:hypothetical protein
MVAQDEVIGIYFQRSRGGSMCMTSDALLWSSPCVSDVSGILTDLSG